MMSWAKWTARTVLVTTGLAAAGGGFAGAALAGTGGAHTGKAPVSTPAGTCANAVTILGIETASCRGGGTLMPRSVLSSVPKSEGMSGDSFATLAIGALLAGAAAVNRVSRRSRIRKAVTL